MACVLWSSEVILALPRNGSSYKFMYSDMDSYVGKVTRIVNSNFHESSIVVKPTDHNIMLQELKVNFLSTFKLI